MSDWRLTFASAIGTSHLKAGTICQDYCAAHLIGSEGNEILLACVADGAGSAPRSAEGAQIACETFLSLATDFFQAGNVPAMIEKHFVCDSWIDRIRGEILRKAEEGGVEAHDFATTFLAAIVSDSHSVFFQIGDGAIVVNDSGESEDYTVVFWPQHGEYANTTNFLTGSTALLDVEFDSVARKVYRVALFSDGLERLLLDLANCCAGTKSIEQLMQPLLTGSAPNLNLSLAAWLQSKPVTDRTDDDKSLILAARIP